MSEAQEMSPVDKETCEAMRREEWEVLEVGLSYIPRELYELKCTQSIFPDFLLNSQHTAEGRIELEIPVELPEELSWRVTVMHPDEQAQQDPYPLSVTTLPPVTLSLILPVDYPLHRPPVISELHATYGWLPTDKLKLLERSLLAVWEGEREQGGGEGRAVLYDWIEMVRSAESCLGKLGMVTNENVL